MAADAPNADEASDPLAGLTERLTSLESQLTAEREQRARLEGALSQMQRAPESSPQQTETAAPREYSRVELQKMVDEGVISESERDERLERQLEAKLSKRLRTELSQSMQQEQTGAQARATIQRYVDRLPGLLQVGSETDRKAVAEFDQLKAMGMPDNDQTRVVALRNVFGPAEKIPEQTAAARETHAETGGSGGAEARDAGKPKWQKGLTAGQIAAQQRQLDNGLYAGPEDPFFVKVVETARRKNKAKG